MPSVTGPLFSLTARKTLKKTLTFSRWRGVQYVRSRVIPANPNTIPQQDQRANFSNLSSYWNYAGTRGREPWTAKTAGQPLTDRNQLIKSNIPAIFGDANMNGFIGSPGAANGPAPAAAVPTPGSGTVSIAVTAPGIPTGWSIVEAVGIAFKDFDPTAIQSAIAYGEGFDATSTYAVVISGLTAGSNQYRVWLKWAKPDGTNAYSISIGGQTTIT